MQGQRMQIRCPGRADTASGAVGAGRLRRNRWPWRDREGGARIAEGEADHGAAQVYWPRETVMANDDSEG